MFVPNIIWYHQFFFLKKTNTTFITQDVDITVTVLDANNNPIEKTDLSFDIYHSLTDKGNENYTYRCKIQAAIKPDGKQGFAIYDRNGIFDNSNIDNQFAPQTLII